MAAKILIVEDEAGMVTALRDRLKKEGYAVTAATDGMAGFDLANREHLDLIILDLMLPGQSGLTICQKLRQQGSTVPILMLTARRQTIDKVVGLRTGADDYLTKPFKMAELLARIDALLRRAGRSPGANGSQYQFGAVRIDVKRTEVTLDGSVVTLSAKEFQLLRYLAEHRGETLSREVLLDKVWGYDATPSTRTVDVHVSWLRQKLEKDPKEPRLILTVVGLGYKLAD
jgi:two-component system, OmpR family, alkaline phosphatase synthesis response regulator PhoP